MTRATSPNQAEPNKVESIKYAIKVSAKDTKPMVSPGLSAA